MSYATLFAFTSPAHVLGSSFGQLDRPCSSRPLMPDFGSQGALTPGYATRQHQGLGSCCRRLRARVPARVADAGDGLRAGDQNRGLPVDAVDRHLAEGGPWVEPEIQASRIANTGRRATHNGGIASPEPPAAAPSPSDSSPAVAQPRRKTKRPRARGMHGVDGSAGDGRPGQPPRTSAAVRSSLPTTDR